MTPHTALTIFGEVIEECYENDIRSLRPDDNDELEAVDERYDERHRALQVLERIVNKGLNISDAQAEIERLKKSLLDPMTVYVNILHGKIALTKEQALRIAGVDPIEYNLAMAPALDELARAKARFPYWPNDPFHALAIIGEEFGELQQTFLKATYEECDKPDIMEAVQLAAMALRFVENWEQYTTLTEHHDESKRNDQ